MDRLRRNKLILFLLCAVVLLLLVKSNEQESTAIVVKQPTKSIAAKSNKLTTQEPMTKQIIDPNPNRRSILNNPFKPLDNEYTDTAMGLQSAATIPVLHGIVSKNNEYLAIISVQGRTDFYQTGQRMMDYHISAINSNSVTLYHKQSQRQTILHLKE